MDCLNIQLDTTALFDLALIAFSHVLGAVEYKLFVGSLNKFATEKEVEEVCSSTHLF